MKSIIIFLYLGFLIYVLEGCGSKAKNEKIQSKDTSNASFPYALLTDIPQKFTNNFEGELYLVERTLFDTNCYRYLIKNSFVRIDEIKDTQILNISIINLIDNKIIRINPKKKMYVVNYINNTKEKIDTSIEVKNSGNYKIICGEKCFQWRIKNKTENFELSFWVSENKDYNFYYYLLNYFRSKFKHIHYYLILPHFFGKLPLEITEYTTLRDFVYQIKVVKINRIPIDTSFFYIYRNYALYHNL
ncbi:MAG: DUF4412 domain-containing protein [Bacteroidales bacterium]|nr:DUF4412 domain-containing protein [Bacteroidales bacterium]